MKISKFTFIKMLLIFSSIFMKNTIMTAQTTVPYGQVGPVIIDQQFINRLQFINPEFGFNRNIESFKILVLKNYSYVKSKSDAIKSSGAAADPAVQADLAAILQIVTDKYLAALFDKKQSDSIYTATDAEAQTYYQQHIAAFSTPEVYSYWLAYVTDTIANPVSKARKQIKEYAAVHKDEFTTGDKGTSYYVYEKDRVVGKNDYYYPILSALKDGDFHLIGNGDKSVIIMMKHHMTGGGTKPFAEIKEQCKAIVINEKRIRAMADFITAAEKQYPVSLNPDLFKDGVKIPK